MSLIESLDAAILAEDAEACARVLAGVPEAERRKAAPTVVEWCGQYGTWSPSEPGNELNRRIARNSVASVALHGTATLAQIKRLSRAQTWLPLYPVLADRRPEWLSEWVAWTMEEPFLQRFPDVRRFIREDLAPKPASDGYILAVIHHLAPKGQLEEWASREPDLLDYEIWRIFEVEGTQSLSLASADKYGGSWREGLIDLANRGIVARSRLLDSSLDALERDFAPFRAAWFSGFHEALKPSLDEAADRADRYLGLIGSRVPSTVSMAMKAVARLGKSGRLDPDAACATIGPALAARQKTVALSALKLLASLAAHAPQRHIRVAEAAATALAHASPEVQKAAMNIVESCAPGDAATIANSYEEALAPTVRARMGIDAADVMPVSLDRARRTEVNPIRDLDDLVESFSAALENPEPPDELERLLDAVSRMCGERPARFEALTAPLATRAGKMLARDEEFARKNLGTHAGQWSPSISLAALALAWIRGESFPAEVDCHGLGSFLASRVLEIARRAGQRKPAVLIGTPSHTGAAIDPAVFVERLTLNPEPDRLDLIQGLLRLTPENRPEALAAAAALPGEVGAAVRWALGSESANDAPGAANAPLSFAANLVRDPTAGAVSYSLQWKRLTRQFFNGEEHTYLIPDLVRSPRLQYEVVYPADLASIPGTSDAAMLRWCATVWPGNSESFFAAGVEEIARNLDWDSATWSNRVYLETLAAYAGPYGPMALTLLALGLAAKEPSEAITAADALIHALSGGRVTGATLGEVCAKLAVEGPIKISRWVKQFANVARTYPPLARELFVVQDQLLASGAPIGKHEISTFLELVCELKAASGQALGAGARQRLATASYGGKAAKIIQSLR